MSTTTFLDAGYVIALINHRDQHHARATELATQYEGRAFVTTEAVLLEIGNGLARKFRRQGVEVIQMLLTSPDVTVVRSSPELFAAGFALYEQHQDKQWGLTDCMSFAVMKRDGIEEALTPDQHFVQAGFQAILR